MDEDASATGMTSGTPSSASLENPTYWWYRARSDLLRVVFEAHLFGVDRVLDVGSADGPSVSWLAESVERVPMDIHPSGLGEGGVCGSITALPFRRAAFGVVSAFDVIEHVEDDHRSVQEIVRVLAPGGLLMASVPAYQWAWGEVDVHAGHYRRYTRRRLVRLLEAEGLTVERATYAFAATFPLFVGDRVSTRIGLRKGEYVATSSLPAWAERLLMWLARWDYHLLRRVNLPFGSSVFALARKRGDASSAGR